MVGGGAVIELGVRLIPTGWPTSFTDHIEDHYAISEAASGYVVDRTEPWAPCCEPSACRRPTRAARAATTSWSSGS